MLLIGGILLSGLSIGFATDTATFLFRKITAKRGSQIQIDGKAYVLHPEGVIPDGEGRAWEWKSLAAGHWVEFHLNSGRIDQIVVLRPR